MSVPVAHEAAIGTTPHVRAEHLREHGRHWPGSLRRLPLPGEAPGAVAVLEAWAFAGGLRLAFYRTADANTLRVVVLGPVAGPNPSGGQQ